MSKKRGLTPITKPKEKRRFKTYDLEWIPGNKPDKASSHGFEPMELRLVGVYDGYQYVAYRDIRSFLNGELTRANRGMWFYAHAGGMADIRFIFEYLIDHPNPHVRVNAFFSGSSAIIVKVTKGRNHWYFLDSYWLMRQSLRKIGEWMGMDKGGAENNTDMFYAPLGVLMEYNKLDCEILYRAIETFEYTLMGLGGQLEMTVASSAMSLFRRAYLKKPIKPMPSTNDIGRHAYVASRVEVFEKECREADYYDINSSFPYAMTFDAPGNYIASRRVLPDTGIHIVDATIRIPECAIPPLPYRTDDKRIYFPTGTWRSWFSNVDLVLLEESGGSIIQIHEVVSFEPFGDLKNYAENIYELRKNSQDDAEKAILKILLNSLYGKFAEGERKSQFVINPPAEFFNLPEADVGGIGRSYIMPGVHEYISDTVVPHCHVPIAVHITAIARANIARFMWQASKVYYCDTDGFACPDSDTFPSSNELGGLKKEKHIYHGKFAAPKLYAYQEQNGGDWTIKAKGFSKVRGRRIGTRWEVTEDDDARPISYREFCDLLEHKELPIEHFVKLKQGLKSGNHRPQDGVTIKTWKDSVRPKRCFRKNGSSRAWRVWELE